MHSSEASTLVDALLEEIDEDELLGSMLYAMTEGEKRRLKNKLINQVLLHNQRAETPA
jgi:hypothetical protein